MLPGTLRRALRQDRNLALRLYDRGVPLQKIEDAFVLALGRRTFRSSSESIEPICSLHYFLPTRRSDPPHAPTNMGLPIRDTHRTRPRISMRNPSGNYVRGNT
jgi:hypothetical protein